MTRFLLPLVLAIVGIGAGVGAGLAMRPGANETEQAAPGAETGSGGAERPSPDATGNRDYVKLNDQFIVPIIHDTQLDSMMIVSLGLEIDEGTRENIYAIEPKLRDILLQVMFDHANMGGFNGVFTQADTLDVLRRALTDAARQITGPVLHKVLIRDIARQDL